MDDLKYIKLKRYINSISKYLNHIKIENKDDWYLRDVKNICKSISSDKDNIRYISGYGLSYKKTFNLESILIDLCDHVEPDKIIESFNSSYLYGPNKMLVYKSNKIVIVNTKKSNLKLYYFDITNIKNWL